MPLFVMFSQWGMINNRLTVIIAIVTKSLPFAVLLLRPYLQSLPGELEDAGRGSRDGEADCDESDRRRE